MFFFIMRKTFQAMKLAGCFNGTKTSYMPKDQGKFDFSCHDPFKIKHLSHIRTPVECTKHAYSMFTLEIDRYIGLPIFFLIFKHFTIIGYRFWKNRFFVTYTIIQSITRSEMCSLHLTHPRAHTHTLYTHTHTPGAVFTQEKLQHNHCM